MVKNSFLSCCLCFLSIVSFTQTPTVITRPKLVIGLVIDQMRWDYLYRYYDLYSDNGFKRLLNDGFSCENTFLPYVPTYTGPGHSSIFTGSVPAINGIIGNQWYDESTGKIVYCTDDASVNTVGSNTEEGKMSPRNLWTTTIGDELRLATNFSSKVIGISLKDRASILPAGHSANAAYWFDGSVGKWITSSFYAKELPAWVTKENEKMLADSYMAKDWTTLLPLSRYSQSTIDDENFEGRIPGEISQTFPHKLSQIPNASKYESFKFTPFGSSFTFEMAKQTIENEKMGSGTSCDMLTISVSSTDYVGHTFGPNSIETEDTYLRLDKDIADFLKYLDAKLGEGNYLLFLTADHAVAHIPAFLQQHNIPAGIYNSGALKPIINKIIFDKYKLDSAVVDMENNQVYLNMKEIENKGLNTTQIKNDIVTFLKEQPYIVDAFSTDDIESQSIPEPIKQRLINGYNSKRSGQVGYFEKPGYIEDGPRGTTHGSWNPYDARIPLLWFGFDIKPGKTNREVYMTDIAPTVSTILHIQMPNGCVGKVIEEVMK
jgi:predicted AlkP superfamily pyrophosphatase or phosphodiesterase